MLHAVAGASVRRLAPQQVGQERSEIPPPQEDVPAPGAALLVGVQDPGSFNPFPQFAGPVRVDDMTFERRVQPVVGVGCGVRKPAPEMLARLDDGDRHGERGSTQ